MKKFVCLFVVLMLCAVSAFAESVPSKTAEDLTQFAVAAENVSADAALVVRSVTSDDAAYQENLEACQAEIEKLASSNSVETYFGEITDAEGNVVDLKAALEAETLNVYEFCPIVADGYEEEYGNVTVTMAFATPYEAGEKVIVLIGLPAENESGEQVIQWVAYEGVCTADGAVEVVFDAQTMKNIQDGTALMAVVSK